MQEELFSKWRGWLWPVHPYEYKKVIPLFLMKFFISFNFVVLHATKDTLVVTYSKAESIPILKGGVVLFFAFLFMLGYSKLSNCVSKTRLFYFILTPFIIFFFLYGFFLYPNREFLALHKSADCLASLLGAERTHWVFVYRYWMDSLFFLMAELWGGVVIGLLFWGFANQINTMKEASRFYTLISASGHVGVIAAGPLIWQCAQSHFTFTIQYLMSFVILAGCFVLLTYWWVNRHVVMTEIVIKDEKPKISLKQSLLHIISSPSLGFIALMLIGYSISVNMVEVVWKATLKIKYPNANEYEAFMGIVSFLIGCVSLPLAFFVGGNVIRRLGWYIGAQITPIVLAFFSFLFLTCFFLNFHFLFVSAGALFLLVVLGAMHNIACKSMKYCLFDPTKEMAYITLSDEEKVKGKAAVDVVAARFGKSGSSWVQLLLIELVGAGSILNIVPYITPLVLIVISLWMLSVNLLKKRLRLAIEA